MTSTSRGRSAGPRSGEASNAAASGPRILSSEPGRLSTAAAAALRSLGEVHEVEADRQYLLDRIADYDALFIGLRNVIDRDIVARAGRLRCIVTPTTGTDHIDVEAARARGIAILSLQGETEFLRQITATAELTWGLLLSLIRHIPAAHEDVLQGEWMRDRFYGIELAGKCLGVVGYGRLGRIVSEYGAAFRMRVLAFDHHPESESGPVEFVPLRELLGQADIVSLHLPLTSETDGFFTAELFAEMKDGAVFLNTARGKLVDESALLEALRRGKLGGAALDVMAGETSADLRWLEQNELVAYARQHSNLILTPHMGGVTSDSVESTNLFMIRKLARFLTGQPGEPCAT